MKMPSTSPRRHTIGQTKSRRLHVTTNHIHVPFSVREGVRSQMIKSEFTRNYKGRNRTEEE